MRLVLGQDRAVAEWVAAHIPGCEGADDFGLCVAIGVTDEAGQALGGVVFNNWDKRHGNIEINGAAVSRRWLTKTISRAIISYPFAQLGCGRITALTPRKARPARQFLEKFGFRREGLVRHGYGKDDCVVYGLLRKEWAALPWGGLDGKEVPSCRADAA